MLRVWDFIFYSGGVNIFRVIISILKMKEQEIVEIAETTQSSADIFTALSQLPASVRNLVYFKVKNKSF